MGNLLRALGKKTLQFFQSGTFKTIFLRQLILLTLIVALVGVGNSAKIKSTAQLLPLYRETAVIIQDLPSSSPKLDSLEGKIVKGATSTDQKPVSTSHPLCKDVKESWKLIPDPSHEGQYVICNTKTETMTTVDELNVAQNAYRKDHGAGILSIDSSLCQIAAERAKEISANFSHDGFEAAVDRHSLQKSAVGENIASGPLSGIHFVEWSWDKSPGHRENMLRDWTSGCGGVYSRFAVFIFAK